MSTPAVLYTLITVTYGGDVGHSRGYESLQMCQEAASVAQTGKTIEEARREAEAAEEARRKRTEAWKAAHPPRPPRNDEERELVKAFREHKIMFGGGFSVTEEGLIQDWPSSTNVMGMVGFPTDTRSAIKYAKCVIEPEAPKP